jgi:hypothetical protein
MEISKQAFCIARTPAELAQYVQEAYEYISSRSDIRKIARLKREPYKAFIEELLPFSAFCSWKYGQRGDVLCSLVAGTPGRDAVCKETETGREHSVEITWPIEGKLEILEAKKINEQGFTCKHWNGDDLSEHEQAINRILSVANKKAFKDYRFQGGSTLIFVFDKEPLFWKSNPKHKQLINHLIARLKQIEFKAGNVILMLMPNKRIIAIKSSEKAPGCNTTSCAP